MPSYCGSLTLRLGCLPLHSTQCQTSSSFTWGFTAALYKSKQVKWQMACGNLMKCLFTEQPHSCKRQQWTGYCPGCSTEAGTGRAAEPVFCRLCTKEAWHRGTSFSSCTTGSSSWAGSHPVLSSCTQLLLILTVVLSLTFIASFIASCYMYFPRSSWFQVRMSVVKRPE